MLVWTGICCRLSYVQVIHGKEYRTQGVRQGQIREPLAALRGNIFDRKGVSLTQNIIHYTIAAFPKLVTNKNAIAAALSECTGRDQVYYLDKLQSKNHFVYLERNLPKETCAPFLTRDFDGISIERKARRFYPHRQIVGQVVGFADVDDKGLTGIERQFDKYINGEPGWIIKQRDGLGGSNVKIDYPMRAPVDGSHIQLTIDLEYQTILKEELQQRVEETTALGATGIILNPQTGAIIAMASVPDFDPNQPNHYAIEFQKIRAITDQFEPGSTFKVVSTTAALELETVTPNDEFYCESGSYKYENITIEDHEKYEILTVSQIIEHSSNIGIIKISETISNEQLYKYARRFGFGSLTAINLDGEVPGTLRKPSEWSRISRAEMSMGQEVGITALQLAIAYSAIANGGFLLKPRLVEQIVNPDQKIIYSEKPEVIRKVSDRKVMDDIKNMLGKVVQSGTGIQAGIPGWEVAGKTGTAQKFIDGSYSQRKFISNFVGFFPASDPQLLCAILLDEPRMPYHWGGIGAAPLFNRIMKRIINLDDTIQPPIPQVDENKNKPILVDNEQMKDSEQIRDQGVYLSTVAAMDIQSNKNIILVPEVRGMSLKKAITTLKQAGLNVKFQGSGRVVWQSPGPGKSVNKNSQCIIGLQ
ncbi:MAG: penicillin-binding protein [Candidatus Neomarinimicrobiota bacterium]